MNKLYHNYIDGKFYDSLNNNTFHSVNPYDPDEVVGEFINSNEPDIDYAVNSSVKAFKTWSKGLINQRVEILRKSIQQIEDNKTELAEIMTKEQGKPLQESLGEITKSIAESRFMIGEGLRLNGQTSPNEKPNSTTKTIRVPIGPIVAITPWNFPVLTPLRKIVPALLTGNTVVIKPSELTPLTGLKLIELFHHEDFPEGILNLVNGGKETGELLTNHDSIRAITFTGSTNVGRQINKTAADKMIRVQAELGGKNPVGIWNYDNLKKAVQETIGAAFACTGQRCTAISRIIVPHSELKEIEELLIDEINQVELGNGLEPKTTMGPLISEEQRNKVDGLVKLAQEEGAEVVVGGEKVLEKKGYFFTPTLLSNVTKDMNIAKEEVFGPVLCLQAAESFDEAID